MKKTEWMDVIGKIDPAYVKEAEEWKKSTQKKRTARHFLAMAACVCCLLAGAASMFTLFLNDNEKGTETATAYEAAETDTEAAGIQTDTDEMIAINQTDQLQTYAVDNDYAKESILDGKELEEYYGVHIFLENLPKELIASTGKEEKETSYVEAPVQASPEKMDEGEAIFLGKIYYNEAGKVVGDNNTFFYESADGKRSLTINVRTMESDEITEFVEEDLKTSIVNGNEVTIAHLADDDDCYLAIFTKEGVTFTIRTKNLTEAELLMVLRELC